VFEEARKIHSTATESGGDQEIVKKGCSALNKCEDMINKLGLFSSNETKEDISITDLKYILVCYFSLLLLCFLLYYHFLLYYQYLMKPPISSTL
jgi:hypothetical protein